MAEQLVVQGCVDGKDGQDVGGEGERIDSDSDAVGADLSSSECSGELVGERPGIVVDRLASRTAVLGCAKKTLTPEGLTTC
jgi:hypothetical protein